MTIPTLNDVLLTELLEVALGATASRVAIPPNIARKIETADNIEKYCHIEWPNFDNNYTSPHVWRIDDWKISNKRHTQKKEVFSQERNISVRATELRAAFVRQLGIATGCGTEMCEPLAKAIIAKRNADAAKIYNIDITELLEADKALTEYKLSKGIKL